VTAPARLLEAADLTEAPPCERWYRAEQVRQEWLSCGLCTEPADRDATEQSLARIYARLLYPRPSFRWVDSPHQAMAHLAGLPTHADLYRWVYGRPPPGKPPLASDLAAGVSRLRSALDARVVPAIGRPPKNLRLTGDRWVRLPPVDALALGVPLPEVLGDGFHRPVRSLLAAGGPLPVCWYGQQDAWWVAYYDVLHRLGLAEYPRAESEHLADWATLVRSCGWWWPGETVCVVVDRPATVHTGALPGSWYDEVRLSFVEYRDGWRPPLPADGGAT
jgi:hypothetical protein